MYLHLGQDTVIKMDEIIGIFDMDTSTLSKTTCAYLAACEKKGPCCERVDGAAEVVCAVPVGEGRDHGLYLADLLVDAAQAEPVHRQHLSAVRMEYRL